MTYAGSRTVSGRVRSASVSARAGRAATAARTSGSSSSSRATSEVPRPADSASIVRASAGRASSSMYAMRSCG